MVGEIALVGLSLYHRHEPVRCRGILPDLSHDRIRLVDFAHRKELVR